MSADKSLSICCNRSVLCSSNTIDNAITRGVKASSQLQFSILAQIWHAFNLENRCLVYNAYFQTNILDILYSVNIWVICNASHVKKVQIFQNNIIKIYYKTPTRKLYTSKHNSLKSEVLVLK